MKYKFAPCTEDDAALLERKLEEYDHIAAPANGTAGDLVLKIIDGEGSLIAGCTGGFDDWGCLDLCILWVDEPYRRQGMGSALAREALRTAKDRGCDLVTFGAFGFQAGAFFERFGFTAFETIEDCPKGSTHRCWAKRLGAEETPAKTPFAIKCGDETDAEIIWRKFMTDSENRVPRRHAFVSLDKKIIDETGALIAGVVANVSGWNLGYVDALWVEEPYRNHGFGSILLREVEREAREQGGTMMLASGYDRQAAFFLARGYSGAGELDDCPKGSRFYSLKKDL